MTTTTKDIITEIANDLVAHCKTPSEDMLDHDAKIWDKHFAQNWTSIEGDGKEYVGRDAVMAKYKEWQAGVTCHSCEVTGPFLGRDSFSVIFDLDMESKDGTWPRTKMQEVAIYTVENGKVIKEEFCYRPMECSGGCDCE